MYFKLWHYFALLRNLKFFYILKNMGLPPYINKQKLLKTPTQNFNLRIP